MRKFLNETLLTLTDTIHLHHDQGFPLGGHTPYFIHELPDDSIVWNVHCDSRLEGGRGGREGEGEGKKERVKAKRRVREKREGEGKVGRERHTHEGDI